MKAKIAEAALNMADNELKREKLNWKEFIEYLRNIPKNIIKDVLLIAPRFVLLLIKILKSNEIDAGLKILFSGMIIAISTLLGFMIWEMNVVVMFGLVLNTFGFVTAVTGIIFGSVALLIKSSLTAFLVLSAMFLCNTVFTTDELNELAKEAFGEEEGRSFMEKFNSIIKSTDNGIKKFIVPVKEFFIKIGKRKQKKDSDINFSDLEGKIKSTL